MWGIKTNIPFLGDFQILIKTFDMKLNSEKTIFSLFFTGSIFLIATSCGNINQMQTNNCPEKIEIDYNSGLGKRIFITKCDSTLRTEYDSEGRLRIKSHWYKGKQDGSLTVYWPNGNIEQISYWENGVQQKETKFYFENGTLEQWYELKDGEPHGKYERYYPNGVLRSAGIWSHGEKIGIWHYYNEDGTLKETKNFDLKEDEDK